jgi:hypothetical protein
MARSWENSKRLNKTPCKIFIYMEFVPRLDSQKVENVGERKAEYLFLFLQLDNFLHRREILRMTIGS